MLQYGTGFISDFSSENDTPIVIDRNNAVFTICAREDMKTGGHGRVQLNAEAVQVFDNPDWEDYDDAVDELQHLDTTKYHSYQISSVQANMIVDSFVRFMAKNTGGRYAYSLPGGKLGRVFQLLKGKRGVNCADLTLKLLNDAGIPNVGDKLINTPRYSAGSSNR